MSTPDQQKMDLHAPMADTTRIGDYKFEPIRGYPMLNWAGKRPFMATHYFPAQLKEQHGAIVDEWRNKLYWGDNLQVMSHLLHDFRGAMKLIYIDPPFDSKADYKKTIQIKGQVVKNDMNTFEEKQYSDIWTNDEYLQFMYERLILLRELLADDGSIYIHLDWHIGHYMKVIMDEIFGKDNFKNELIWKRSLPHNDPKKYGAIHDTILFYTKTDTYIFNQQYQEQSEQYKKSHYSLRDSSGRAYRLQSLSASGSGPARMFGERVISPPPGTHWRYSQENLDELLASELIVFTSTGQPCYKRYLDESKGSALQSLWMDLNPLNPQARERLNYPTQKPESLLNRIILASSNPGDIVFDCFMGSGTTQVVAMKLGRQFIGADINMGAIHITTKRLLTVVAQLSAENGYKLPAAQTVLALEDEEEAVVVDAKTTKYTGFEMYNVNNYDIFRNPVQAKELLIEALELNRLQAGGLFDGERDGRLWKIMPVNRIATRADLNELISGLDYRNFQGRMAEHPATVVEKVTLVCMGHEPDLAAVLRQEVKASGFDIDVAVVDILREQRHLEFRHDAEARIVVRDEKLHIEQFYPLNLLNKLSLQKEAIKDWRDLVESVMIDWNYDGAIFQPALTDIPAENGVVTGVYPVPKDAGTIRVKITDLLAESLEKEIRNG